MRHLTIPPSILEPVGPDARHIAELWWWMLALAAVAIVVVTVFATAILFRRSPGTASRLGSRTFLVGGGLILSLALLLPAGFLTIRAGLATAGGGDHDLTVDIVGHQWWWEIRYPGHEVTTAHEVVVPTGTPIRFRVASTDVIHSFWVPNAGPKIDAIPGRVNELILRFDETGVFWGACAEFCGLQHARMQLRVIAMPPPEFEGWLDQQRLPAAEPETELEEQGLAVFSSGECVGCHTIRGEVEVAARGPDLTHLASRETFAGATVDLTEENLRAFLQDPESVKEGVLMPRPLLTSEELEAVLAYLLSLE